MATGDKIFIADKETLDKVNERTGSTQQDIKEVKEVVTQINTSLSSLPPEDNAYNVLTAADIRKLSLAIRTAPGGVSYTKIFELTQPGTLYMAVIGNQPSSTTGFQVIVDGTMIVSSTLAPAGSLVSYSGFFSRPVVVGLNTNSQLQLVNGWNIPINLNPGITPISPTAAANIYSFSPVKWNTSLVINGYCNGSTATVHIYYKLD